MLLLKNALMLDIMYLKNNYIQMDHITNDLGCVVVHNYGHFIEMTNMQLKYEMSYCDKHPNSCIIRGALHFLMEKNKLLCIQNSCVYACHYQNCTFVLHLLHVLINGWESWAFTQKKT